MKEIVVKIVANGYSGLTPKNIEKALDHYFVFSGSGVSFSVKYQGENNMSFNAYQAREKLEHNRIKRIDEALKRVFEKIEFAIANEKNSIDCYNLSDEEVQRLKDLKFNVKHITGTMFNINWRNE